MDVLTWIRICNLFFFFFINFELQIYFSSDSKSTKQTDPLSVGSEFVHEVVHL